MTLYDIRSYTRAIPFQPFRVTIATGEEFDIKHPDMLMAMGTMAHLPRPLAPGENDERGNVAHVPLDHVLKIEYLTDHAAPPVNKSTV